ncbi:hypothetical protein RBU61_00030 [Tissierella sp. MB52-C2]|uniref:hypothetical protein n=1 Tax=Tissierella sp. MB52-C2 TaxID=3070999 RepID=UPI00280ADDA6|nr:hypothetical protein [Tissierella sp. MB52-C2]WMM25081.1 hypothetical protein RBU61_00030 [Tissierella sp. MB52-C2]
MKIHSKGTLVSDDIGLDRDVNDLSGGQKNENTTWLNFFLEKPDILLLDEPTN